MQKFKRKSLYLALVAAVSSVGIANTASAAVHINDNGLGQVLIYPYYTSRNDMNTYMSVVNTTTSSKAVKVRFTEGKNSREVLDFNLYLSPNDMWSAVIYDSGSGAKLKTFDKSCTAGPIDPVAGKDFVNFAYSGAVKEGIVDAGGDGEIQSLDRTREGYFEIIEMGVITNTAINAAVTHVNGVPANCAVVQAGSMNMGTSSPSTTGNQSAALARPSGGLAGTATLINVTEGTEFGYDPVVLDSFTSRNIWDVPGSILPDLRSADLSSVIFDGGTVVSSAWSVGNDTVNALLMHSNIINEYILDQATLSGTDWVITMPTKRYSVPVDDPSNSIDPQLFSPFTHKFWADGACEPVSLSYWNREEGKVDQVTFSPLPPGGVTALCWETNVVTFSKSGVASNVLGSKNVVTVPVNFENGWLRMSFNATGINVPGTLGQMDDDGTTHSQASQSLTSLDGDTYIGLPTVGFMVQDYINGNVGGVLSNYGGNFIHKYTTEITSGN